MFYPNTAKYIPGVHCGDKNCYACGTMRYNCNKLNELDKGIPKKVRSKGIGYK